MKRSALASARDGAYIIAGLIVLGLSAVLQMSSNLTPFLSNYPLLLYGMGSAGIVALMVVGGWAIVYGMAHQRASYYALGVGYISLSLLIYFNSTAFALQLALAGLTIGGSLLSLGCSRIYFHLTARS